MYTKIKKIEADAVLHLLYGNFHFLGQLVVVSIALVCDGCSVFALLGQLGDLEGRNAFAVCFGSVCFLVDFNGNLCAFHGLVEVIL